MEKGTQKIWFLQLTRVIACLTVVYIHWYGLISTPNVLHEFIKLDPLANYPVVNLTDYLGIITHYLKLDHFLGVYFGLGMFFILSGYVIPLSLKNSNPRDYLIRRIFRIYPTLIICLFITIIMMTFANFYLESSQRNTQLNPITILSNLLLVRDVLNIRYIENATWTLDIEVHFYLLFFFFFYYAIEKRILTFILFACGLLVCSELLFYIKPFVVNIRLIKGFIKLVTLNSSYLTFMFIGTTIYYTLSKQWTYIKGIATLILLLVIHYYCLQTSSEYSSIIFINHLYAMGLFLILYYLNNYIPYSSFLNKIAEISYPLYLTHGFTGYTMYFLIYHATENVLASTITAFACVLILATLIHYFVEKPGINFSKEIIKRWDSLRFVVRRRKENLLGNMN